MTVNSLNMQLYPIFDIANHITNSSIIISVPRGTPTDHLQTCNYSTTPLVFIVTALPLKLTHTVNGSLPNCSLVLPAGAVTPTGNWTGIGTEQVLVVPAETVTEDTDFLSSERL